MDTEQKLKEVRLMLTEVEDELAGMISSDNNISSLQMVSSLLVQARHAVADAGIVLEDASQAARSSVGNPPAELLDLAYATCRRDYRSVLSLLENSFDAVYWRNLTTDHYDYISPVIEQITGFSPDEFCSMKMDEVMARIHPSDRGAVLHALDCVKGGGKRVIEYRFKGKDGSYRWLADSLYVQEDPGCEDPCRIGIVRDVSEQRETEQALRDSEERFRLMAENIDRVFWFYDLERKQMIYISPAFERIWGVTVGELYANGRLWLESIHPADRSRLEHTLERWHSGIEDEYDVEFRIVRTDGDVRWIADRGTVIGRRRGRPTRVCGIARDVTDRKRADDELLRANERLELALCGAGVWDWDITTGDIGWTPDMFRLFGLDPERDRPGFDTWNKVLHPDDRKHAADRIDRAVRTGSMLENEYRVVQPDGTLRWISALGRTICDAAGEPQRMVGICIDVTRRRQAEEALQRSEDRYRSLVEMSPDALFINENNRIVFINHAGLRLIGAATPEQVLGKTPYDLIHPDYHEVIRERIDRQLLGENAPLIEEKVLRLDGSIVDVEVVAAPFATDNGMAIQVILRDITERKRAEARLFERQQLLAELNRTLEQRVDEETRKNRGKDCLLFLKGRQAELGEMIGNIAHQWRQPLNTIGLYVQELACTWHNGNLCSDHLDSTVTCVLQLLRHMSQTIDDFRDFLRPDREQKAFNIGETLDRTLSLVSETFRLNSIRVTIERVEYLSANGYSNEFAQVLLTLLNNARDVLVERRISQPCIVVKMERVENRAVISIADNGGGIAEEVMERIFEPYFTTKGSNGGTGIGLYIAKAIIEKSMNGHLTVRNTGDGAEFRIEV